MKNLGFRIILATLALGLLGFLSIYVGQQRINKSVFLFQGIRFYAYSKLSLISSFIARIKSQKSLIEENLKLKEENNNLLARLAGQSSLESQNEFLRQALNLPPLLLKHAIVEAGIFNFQFMPDGYYFSVNKGFDNFIKKNDVVIAPSGIIIGVISEVSKNQSLVSSVANLDFTTTINILSKNVSGIAKGRMGEGIYLDFISHEDDIIEGDIVVTSGTDLLPPGLIVGKIIRVDSEGGGLFKKVAVRPSFQDLNLSRALVIRNE